MKINQITESRDMCHVCGQTPCNCTHIMESTDNVGAAIINLYDQIYELGDDAVDHLYHNAPLFAQFWDQYEGDINSIVAEVSPKNLIRIKKELEAAAREEGLMEFVTPDAQAQDPGLEREKDVDVIFYGVPGRDWKAEDGWAALEEVLPREYPAGDGDNGHSLKAQQKVAEVAQQGGAIVTNKPLSVAQKLVQTFNTYGIKSRINQGLNEFAPPGGDDGFSDDTLKRMAAQWYNGDEDPRIEKTLAAAGWEIGQDEGYDDEPGVFVVQAGDVNGNSYMSWPADELRGLMEFAQTGGGDAGDYLRTLASAWYNDVYNTGNLQKGIKSQEDVEKILSRGVVCPDGKTRKYYIDYNGDFNGVELISHDYYEHADYGPNGEDVDGRTGKPFSAYDHIEYSDEQLDEDVSRRGFLQGLGMAAAGAAGLGAAGAAQAGGATPEWIAKVERAKALMAKGQSREQTARIMGIKGPNPGGAGPMSGDWGAVNYAANEMRVKEGVAEAVTLDRSKNANYPRDPATVKHQLDTAKDLLSDPKTDPDSRREAAAIVARLEKSGVAEGNKKPEPPEADYGSDYQDMVARVKKLAGLGPLKTVYDPQKRVYKNVPTAVQPKKEK